MKLYDLHRWQDRWRLRLRHLRYISFHPFAYYLGGWLQDMQECPPLENARQYKRPVCWVFGHKPDDVEVGEHWIDSEHIVCDWLEVCTRCGKVNP